MITRTRIIFSTLRRDPTGSALVELALSLPLLVLILMGTIDFARVFHMSIELTNAARAGAQYGAYNTANSANAGGMQAAAIAATPDITGPAITAAASLSCRCATDAGAFSNTSNGNCSGTCPANNHMLSTVTVTATRTFTTLTIFPGVPNTLALSRTATLRVDQ